jgi:hypothetical protein
VGGDNKTFPGGTAGTNVGNAPGTVGTVLVKTLNGTSGSITVNGDLIARQGKGAFDGTASVGCTATAQIDVNAATTTGAGTVKIAGNIDTSGGLDASGGAAQALSADTTLANNDWSASSASHVSVAASGPDGANISIQNVTAVGGEGDGGGAGCTVTLKADSAKAESIVFGSIKTTGGIGRKNVAAGIGGDVQIIGASTGSEAFEVAGVDITADGGPHQGVHTEVPSASCNGGKAGKITIAQDAAGTTAKVATIIDVTLTGNLSAKGGALTGRADAARAAGAGNDIIIALGADSSQSVQLTAKDLITAGATCPTANSIAGEAAVAGGNAGNITLTFKGKAGTALADVSTTLLTATGGNGVSDNTTPTGIGAGGHGGTITLNVTSPGKYSFGDASGNSGNGAAASPTTTIDGGNFALTSEGGEVVDVTLGNISVNAGGLNGTAGGKGGDISFTIPSPITIAAKALSANAAFGSGTTASTLGVGGYIHHEGPPTVGYVLIKCTGTPGLVTNTSTLMSGDPPCIDGVFDCSTGQRICGSVNTSP